MGSVGTFDILFKIVYQRRIDVYLERMSIKKRISVGTVIVNLDNIPLLFPLFVQCQDRNNDGLEATFFYFPIRAQ